MNDPRRLSYLQENLAQVLRAKNEEMSVGGYFVWTFTDNFEWAEGYHPRFGLVHVNFETQERTIKNSGLWYRDFLEGNDIAEKERQIAPAFQDISRSNP